MSTSNTATPVNSWKGGLKIKKNHFRDTLKCHKQRLTDFGTKYGDVASTLL